MDITDARQVAAVFNAMAPEVVVHAAAYTDVARAERERERCWRTNVAGTRHVARAAADAGAILIQISTDYVFEGRRGGYREEDVPGPALNYYALSKIAAEEVARTAPRHLVLRTSFRPREWPYPVAFADVYTSQDYVDIIAPDIALVVRHAAEIPFDTLHVATERKSVYELARRRKPDVRAGSKAEARVALPDDVSLDIGRWRALKPQLRAKGA
jgi:dTDP-4-dehydrorhamnose reductase